jgi:type VI secretion system Hcp family effector
MPDTKFLMTMQMHTQGHLTAPSTKKGSLKFGSGMECHSFEYGVIAQYDPGAGQPTGKRTHSPIIIKREVDAASPLLLQCLATNEVFKSVKFTFSRAGARGKPLVAHTIELISATITHLRLVTLSGRKCQEVTLAYDDWLVNGVPRGIIPYSYLS